MNRIYQVGDLIEYVTSAGYTRYAEVTSKDVDIKHGRPGFDAVTWDGMSVWGYDDQVVRVLA